WRCRGLAFGSPQAAGSARVFLGTAGEPDVELLELAVEVRALEPGLLGDAAHVALLAAEELLEVDTLERLARLAQRQVEEARGDLGCDDVTGRRRLAEQALHVLAADVAAQQPQVRDHRSEVIEVARPVRLREHGERLRLQRAEQRRRSLARRRLAPVAL